MLPSSLQARRKQLWLLPLHQASEDQHAPLAFPFSLRATPNGSLLPRHAPSLLTLLCFSTARIHLLLC